MNFSASDISARRHSGSTDAMFATLLRTLLIPLLFSLSGDTRSAPCILEKSAENSSVPWCSVFVKPFWALSFPVLLFLPSLFVTLYTHCALPDILRSSPSTSIAMSLRPVSDAFIPSEFSASIIGRVKCPKSSPPSRIPSASSPPAGDMNVKLTLPRS